MTQFPNDHRGHTIFEHALGPTGGPWTAHYSAWRLEPDNSYSLVANGALPSVYKTIEEAQSAAALEARRAIDALLK